MKVNYFKSFLELMFLLHIFQGVSRYWLSSVHSIIYIQVI